MGVKRGKELKGEASVPVFFPQKYFIMWDPTWL